MGSLAVVGTGIRPGLHMTVEAREQIRRADIVLYLMSEEVSAGVIEGLNPKCESLAHLYEADRERRETYAAMANTILDHVRAGRTVCAAIYGHPGVLSEPGHTAMRMAAAEGYPARMFPGVSSEDCLYADLGVDPGSDGCQSYVAEDFLVRPRAFDTRSPLILKQISSIGESRTPEAVNRKGILILAETLARHYGKDHRVVVYEAATFPIGRPTIHSVAVGDLHATDIPKLATLFVPPSGPAPLDDEIARALHHRPATATASSTPRPNPDSQI